MVRKRKSALCTGRQIMATSVIGAAPPGLEFLLLRTHRFRGWANSCRLWRWSIAENETLQDLKELKNPRAR